MTRASFGPDEVRRFGGTESRRERKILMVGIIHKLLSAAGEHERLWIGLGFGNGDLAYVRPIHFDRESYPGERSDGSKMPSSKSCISCGPRIMYSVLTLCVNPWGSTMKRLCQVYDHWTALRLVNRLADADIEAEIQAQHLSYGDPLPVSVWLINDADLERAAGVLERDGAEGSYTRVDRSKHEGQLKCDECGYDLRAHPGDGRCPECGVDFRTVPVDVKCPHCGEMVPDHFELCWNCRRSTASNTES